MGEKRTERISVTLKASNTHHENFNTWKFWSGDTKDLLFVQSESLTDKNIDNLSIKSDDQFARGSLLIHQTFCSVYVIFKQLNAFEHL